MHAGREVVVHAAQRGDRVGLGDEAQPDHLRQIDALLDEVDPVGVGHLADFEHVVRLAGDVALQIADPRAEAVAGVAGIALVLVDHLGELHRLLGQARQVGLLAGS